MERIRFLYINDWDTGTLTYSSQNSNFPASNTRHRWWTKAWRSIGKTNEWLKINKGSDYTMPVFAMKYNNFTADAQVILQANSIDDFTDPPFSATFSPINQDVMISFLDGPPEWKWWKLLVSDPTNAATYLTIGRVFLGSYWSPYCNFNSEYEEQIDDPSVLVWSEGGQISGILRTKFSRWTYFFENLSKSDRDLFRTMYRTCGISQDLFVCRDADDAYASTSYVRIAEILSVKHIAMDQYYDLNLVVEELR